MARHAILGPSAAYRWLACTPSARFEEQIPEQESDFAKEGSLAHELAAIVLGKLTGVYGDAPGGGHTEYIKALENALTFYLNKGMSVEDAESAVNIMSDHAESWAGFVYDIGGEILIEREYDISRYVPLGFGTADAVNITRKVIYVSDFKYGAGIPVSAVENKQMMLYGLGALLEAVDMGHSPNNVVLSIFQPRAAGLSTWTISVADLLVWAEKEVRPKALLAIAGQGDFVPGKHCQLCKARTSCSAYYRLFEGVNNLRDKRVMTNKERITALTYGPLISSWIKKLEKKEIADIQAGKKLKGFKIVAGTGRRKFRSEDNVIDILIGAGMDSTDIFNSELRSLTDFEKTLGKKKFNTLLADEVYLASGAPTLVPEDDARPAIGASGADEYIDDDINDLS